MPVRVAVIPPLVRGELPGETPRIQDVSAVVSPRPEAMARSAAWSRAKKGAGSAESVDGDRGAEELVLAMAEEKSAIFFSPR